MCDYQSTMCSSPLYEAFQRMLRVHLHVRVACVSYRMHSNLLPAVPEAFYTAVVCFDRAQCWQLCMSLYPRAPRLRAADPLSIASRSMVSLS